MFIGMLMYYHASQLTAFTKTECMGIILQEDEALESLRIIAAALATADLKHLNISDNALGEKGVRAVSAAFKNQVGGIREHLPVGNEGLQLQASCTLTC